MFSLRECLKMLRDSASFSFLLLYQVCERSIVFGNPASCADVFDQIAGVTLHLGEGLEPGFQLPCFLFVLLEFIDCESRADRERGDAEPDWIEAGEKKRRETAGGETNAPPH